MNDKIMNSNKEFTVCSTYINGVYFFVGGCVEEPLEPSGHGLDLLCVDPVLIEEVDELLQHDGFNGEAEQRERHPEEGSDEGLEPWLPERGGEVVLLAGVMVDVNGPQDPHLMVRAMEDVVAEVVEEK